MTCFKGAIIGYAGLTGHGGPQPPHEGP
uniref:Uncharacterized protein n=1 Tax=Anguilla anguilla TaxID=7936 RepID=A0A0E9Q3X7_ANGAN